MQSYGVWTRLSAAVLILTVAAACDNKASSPSTVAPTATASRLTETIAEIQKPTVVGRFVGPGQEGGEVEINIASAEPKGDSRASIDVSAEGCNGGVTGVVTQTYDALRFVALDPESTCAVSLQLDAGGKLVAAEGDGCADFRGAKCVFSGTLVKVSDIAIVGEPPSAAQPTAPPVPSPSVVTATSPMSTNEANRYGALRASIGMSKDQVRALFGAPDKAMDALMDPNSEGSWVYRGVIHPESGKPVSCILIFYASGVASARCS